MLCRQHGAVAQAEACGYRGWVGFCSRTLQGALLCRRHGAVAQAEACGYSQAILERDECVQRLISNGWQTAAQSFEHAQALDRALGDASHRFLGQIGWNAGLARQPLVDAAQQ